MAKQMLIYESVVPLSVQRHADASLEETRDYAFSAGLNAVPLMAVEFAAAAAEYAIVFTEVGEDVLPAAILGARGGHNVYVTTDSTWAARYVPAFIRRYPFVFASTSDGKSLALCVDESHPGVNREGRGERLFTHDGKPTAYVRQVMQFLREYQAHFERTRRFGRTVRELGLLEPVRAQVNSPRGTQVSVGGMQVVSRKRLRELSGDTLADLARNDGLELLHLQMFSLRNFRTVKEKLAARLATGAPAATMEAPLMSQ